LPSYYIIPDGRGTWVSAGPIGFYSAKLNKHLFIKEGCTNNLSTLPFGTKNTLRKNGNNRIAAPPHDRAFETKGIMDNGEIITRKEANIFYGEILKMSHKDIFQSFSPDLIKFLQSTKNGMTSIELMQSNKAIVGSVGRFIFMAGLKAGSWVHWKD